MAKNDTKYRMEVDKFPDGRLKFKVWFSVASNFWIDDEQGTATWVPTLEQINDFKEVLDMVNEQNQLRKAFRRV